MGGDQGAHVFQGGALLASSGPAVDVHARDNGIVGLAGVHGLGDQGLQVGRDGPLGHLRQGAEQRSACTAAYWVPGESRLAAYGLLLGQSAGSGSV